MAKRGWWLLAVGVIAGLWAWRQRSPGPSVALQPFECIVALAPTPRGVTWEPVDSHPSVREAAEGSDPERLRESLESVGLRGLWVGVSVEPPSGVERSLAERMAAGRVVRGFRGAVLSTQGLLYVIDETAWPVALSDRVLARVARGILEGSTPPPLDAFPRELVEEQAVEVLVLLTGARGPRLWRSARAQSIAEGLVTAALAARERWEERRETMGGPLGQRLDELDVQVALLFDDGTFDENAVSLIDSLVTPQHGIGYEQPARWRYLLPRATRASKSPSDAYRRLFRDNDLPEDSFARRDLRLYRLRMETLSVDQGSTGFN